MKTFIQNGDVITVTAPTGGVASGDGVIVDSLFGIAAYDAPAGRAYGDRYDRRLRAAQGPERGHCPGRPGRMGRYRQGDCATGRRVLSRGHCSGGDGQRDHGGQGTAGRHRYRGGVSLALVYDISRAFIIVMICETLRSPPPPISVLRIGSKAFSIR